MLELFKLLLDPKVLSVVTPAGALVAALVWSLYKMASKYDDLQERRITEWKEMNSDYMKLSEDINKTLDLLIKTVGRKNGNGGNCNG
jgi:hypothetical protein